MKRNIDYKPAEQELLKTFKDPRVHALLPTDVVSVNDFWIGALCQLRSVKNSTSKAGMVKLTTAEGVRLPGSFTKWCYLVLKLQDYGALQSLDGRTSIESAYDSSAQGIVKACSILKPHLHVVSIGARSDVGDFTDGVVDATVYKHRAVTTIFDGSTGESDKFGRVYCQLLSAFVANILRLTDKPYFLVVKIRLFPGMHCLHSLFLYYQFIDVVPTVRGGLKADFFLILKLGAGSQVAIEGLDWAKKVFDVARKVLIDGLYEFTYSGNIVSDLAKWLNDATRYRAQTPPIRFSARGENTISVSGLSSADVALILSKGTCVGDLLEEGDFKHEYCIPADKGTHRIIPLDWPMLGLHGRLLAHKQGVYIV